jgi:hypothetical protein
VPEQIADGVERYAMLYRSRGKVMAQIMPAEVGDLRALE